MKIIDLFSGCGGMSLGFELSGFEVLFALEKDLWASETYKNNHRNTDVITEDITNIKNLKDYFNNYKNICFGIIGGPPCQGFSLSGHRDKKDPRNSLFMDYMRFVNFFNPSFFVMENVPGILSSKTKNGEFVKNLIKKEANNNGYNIYPIQLLASDYGVPQSRLRVFFIGIRKDFPFNIDKLIPPISNNKPITIREALSDLPILNAGEGYEEMNYNITPQNDYQRWCRINSKKVMNHISMKHSSRIIERFKCIKFGQSLADVPTEHMQRKRGDAQKISGKVYSQNNMRPWPDLPSPTIPASFQSNFIHPLYNRNYTAREGARLQSFPDNYIFYGKRTTMSWEKNLSQYQQIGNAVPPLLAKAIADNLKNYFDNINSIKSKPIITQEQYDLFY